MQEVEYIRTTKVKISDKVTITTTTITMFVVHLFPFNFSSLRRKSSKWVELVDAFVGAMVTTDLALVEEEVEATAG